MSYFGADKSTKFFVCISQAIISKFGYGALAKIVLEQNGLQFNTILHIGT